MTMTNGFDPMESLLPGKQAPRASSRIMRKLSAGGIRSSVITLASSALGIGPLALPYAMKSTGIVVGSVLLIVASSLMVLSADVLIRCAAEQQDKIRLASPRSMPSDQVRSLQLAVRSWTYLLEMHFGSHAGAVLDALLAVVGCGIIVNNLVFMVQFVQSSIVNLHLGISPSRELLVGVCAALTVLPSLPASIGNMRFMAVWIYTVMIMVSLLMLAGLFTCERSELPVVLVELSVTGVLRAFCLFLFAQFYHFNLYTIFGGLQRPYEWSPNAYLDRSLADIIRMRKILWLTAYSTLAICAVISLIGYLLWRGDTAQDIIQNFSHETCPVGTMRLALVVQAMLVISTVIYIPLNVVPTRISILKLLGLIVSEKLADSCGEGLLRHALTVTLLASLAVVAMTVTSVADIIGFLSGSIQTLICFVLPGIFYKRSRLNEDSPCVRCIILVAFGFSALAGFGNVVAILTCR